MSARKSSTQSIFSGTISQSGGNAANWDLPVNHLHLRKSWLRAVHCFTLTHDVGPQKRAQLKFFTQNEFINFYLKFCYKLLHEEFARRDTFKCIEFI